MIIQVWNNETEETQNQVHGHLFLLLVGLFGPSGGRGAEIPDTGGLFRVIRLGGDYAIAFGHFTHFGSL